MSLNTTISNIGLRWLRIAVVYLIIGITLGIYMGAVQTFVLSPAHAHINLVGWALSSVAGIVYCLCPTAGTSRLGTAHFWLHQVGTPIMLVSLALFLTGEKGAIPTLVIGEFIVAGGVIAFFLNLLLNIKPAQA